MHLARSRPIGPSFHRPELSDLDERERERVHAVVRARRLRCAACGRRRFQIGDVLYLGFLFAASELDEYMVALTCTNPSCPAPRTGITLRGHLFREHEHHRE